MTTPSVAVRYPSLRRWGITLTATAASTYALDVFVTAALRRCRHYVVGGKRFPSADIDEYHVHDVLARRFEHATVEPRRLAEHADQGYSGIVLAWAR